MIKRLVIKAMISFIIGQIEKLNGVINWEKLKADLEKHIRDLVPGTWFDDAAVKFVDMVFDSIRSVLEQGDTIKHLMQLLADKKFDEALALLKDLLLGKIGGLVAFASEEKEVSFAELLA